VLDIALSFRKIFRSLNRTSDLPACSTVPQPTAPPLATTLHDIRPLLSTKKNSYFQLTSVLPSLFVWFVISHSSISPVPIHFTAEAFCIKVSRRSVFRISRLINYILLKAKRNFCSCFAYLLLERNEIRKIVLSVKMCRVI
jgi:hypothetical protein